MVDRRAVPILMLIPLPIPFLPPLDPFLLMSPHLLNLAPLPPPPLTSSCSMSIP